MKSIIKKRYISNRVFKNNKFNSLYYFSDLEGNYNYQEGKRHSKKHHRWQNGKFHRNHVEKIYIRFWFNGNRISYEKHN